MFNLFKSKASSFLGIDVGTKSMKLVELESVSGRPRLVTYGMVEIESSIARENDSGGNQEDNEKMASSLRALLEKSGARALDAVAALPNFSVFSSVISLPRLGEKQLAEAIQWEAKTQARNGQGSGPESNEVTVTINSPAAPAKVTGLSASTSIPVEPIPPSNYTFTSDETTFSWDAAQNADEYWIQYKQDGVWDASWTYVGDSNTRSVMVRPFQMSRDPTSSIGARVRARRLPGGNVTLDGSVSDEVLMFIVQRPRAATMTDPANNSTALRAVFDGQGFVQNIPDTEILYKWIPEGSRYENQYRINFRRDGGVGQDSNRIDDATGWENGAGFTPFGQLEATYRHSTYLVSANNKIEARIKACNRSGCSDNWSNVIAVNIVLPPPGSRTINTISVGVATTEALDTTQDPQYRQLTNSSATTKYYRLKKTSGTGGSTLSIVDGTDTQITSNVVTQSNAIIFSVDAGQTRYIKFTPTSSGSYNHILYQYSSFPPYEGL
ncbi:hypothetical protein CL632_00335 [bacterium]|jgi:hypothetical protein|nr:hypothetical protein [bacterium]